MKMNPEVKQKWVKALRSGRYKQGKGKLQPSKDTFCCLGVLCKVMRLPFIKHEINLPLDVIEKAGLTDPSPQVWYERPMEEPKLTYLSNLNDVDELSFKQIADLIEESL